jgi:tetratricopeptide (TPR) repeat protein
MSYPGTDSGVRNLRICLILCLLVSALPARSQTAQPSEDTTQPDRDTRTRQPPAFSAAGVQGTTAPAGYSSGLSREEMSAAMTRVVDLNQQMLAGLLPDAPAENCQSEPDLLRSAKAAPAAFAPNHALGMFYLLHGETARSIRYLEAASRAEPADTDNARALTFALLGTGNHSEAIARLQRAASIHSRSPALLRLLAFAYDVSGEPEKSVETYQRALAAAPEDAENEFGCGIGLVAAGAQDAAAKVFKSATTMHPAQAEFWLGLGLVQGVERQKGEAVQSLLHAVQIDPEYTPPYSYLASLADASPEHAAEIRNRLAEFAVAHPESAEAHYDYARALWQQHRIDPRAGSINEIQAQLELALARDPNLARAHFQLGVVAAEMGDFAKSESELLQATKLKPNDAEAHYRLAQAYRRNHKPALANAEMRRFLALHGSETRDEESADVRVQDLGPDLLHQIQTAPRCGTEPQQQQR